MQAKELLLTSFQQSYSITMPLLEDLKSAPLVQPTPRGGNHAHWIVGHLLSSEGRFRAMLRGLPNPVEHLQPLFAGGTTPDPAGNGYAPYEELLAQLVTLRQETLQWLETLSDSDLDKPSHLIPPGFELFFGTWGRGLLLQSMHWMNHRGQLADCRRAAGRERLMV